MDGQCIRWRIIRTHDKSKSTAFRYAVLRYIDKNSTQKTAISTYSIDLIVIAARGWVGCYIDHAIDDIVCNQCTDDGTIGQHIVISDYKILTYMIQILQTIQVGKCIIILYPQQATYVSDIGEGSNPDGTTGIFIVSKYFGANENSCSSGVTFNSSTQFRLGRTLTHELGHFFGLYHIFQSIDCNIDEDLIEDTPIQTEPNFGIKSVNENCSSNANNTCVSNEFFFNYMDYGDDSALIMFTVDQATIIYQTALLGNYVHPINNEPILGNQCFDIVYIDYNYQCGPTILYETTARQFRYGGRTCSAPPTEVTGNLISNNGNNGNNDGPGGPGGPGNGNNGTVNSGVNIPPVTTKNEDCRECLDLLLKKLNKAILNNQNGGN